MKFQTCGPNSPFALAAQAVPGSRTCWEALIVAGQRGFASVLMDPRDPTPMLGAANPVLMLDTFDPVPARTELMNEASTRSGRPQLWTGIGKINADGSSSTYEIHPDVTIAHVRMMRIDENIHATYPPYATVAPILHRSARANATDRGTTLNNGAAA